MWFFFGGLTLTLASLVGTPQLIAHKATADLAMPVGLGSFCLGLALAVGGLALWCYRDVADRRAAR